MEPEEAGEPPTGLFVARALGRFAGATHATPPWASRRLLADRLDDGRGARWLARHSARTTLADVTDRLWQRREHWLARCSEGPRAGCTATPSPPTSWPAGARTS